MNTPDYTRPHSKRLRGLYAITDRRLAERGGLERQVEEALEGGARVIQYRDKGPDGDRRFREATGLLGLCRAFNAPLIINDDIELARRTGADGVHLGKLDADLQTAREQLGPNAIIGVSCYDDFDRARAADEGSADYVAFGRFFPSTTKPEAVQAELGLLERSHRELSIPTVAIGGITPENGAALIEAGADMLAVIHAVFGQSDVKRACQAFTRLFDHLED